MARTSPTAALVRTASCGARIAGADDVNGRSLHGSRGCLAPRPGKVLRCGASTDAPHRTLCENGSGDRVRLEEGLLLAGQLEDRDVHRVDVPACRVDLDVLAEHRVAARHRDAGALEHGVADALAGTVGLRDRGQDHLQRLDAVRDVAGRRRGVVLRLVRVQQLLTGTTGLLDLALVLAGEGQVGAFAGGQLVEVRVAGEAVRPDQLDGLVVTEYRDLVLDQLATVDVVDAADVDAVRAGRLDAW